MKIADILLRLLDKTGKLERTISSLSLVLFKDKNKLFEIQEDLTMVGGLDNQGDPHNRIPSVSLSQQNINVKDVGEYKLIQFGSNYAELVGKIAVTPNLNNAGSSEGWRTLDFKDAKFKEVLAIQLTAEDINGKQEHEGATFANLTGDSVEIGGLSKTEQDDPMHIHFVIKGLL